MSSIYNTSNISSATDAQRRLDIFEARFLYALATRALWPEAEFSTAFRTEMVSPNCLLASNC